ncbi:mammalian cell entry protein [Mycobacterium sp. C3-094]|uniref:mammalian cell entry protein n=1 Tax=Mycobacterium sp. PSTR-4-N TaxID=2917745 RepID=UPI001F154E59|nr:mammalian cell entry protein [Mycobacterium sp. PSTR-4-N]MCG7593373.1 mammalian cell entry protein [Mycobacterium sp. PSTR-4-N]
MSRPPRRRASRAAGPATGAEPEAPLAVFLDTPGTTTVRRPVSVSAAPPPRRRANRGLVALVALLALVVLAGALGGGVAWMLHEQRAQEAVLARDQRFVDTASQLVVNMFSYTQDNIDDSVNRFVNGTSGPLRDMLSQGNNVDNLKAIFRDTNASSEAVINGAALEKVDPISGNASVLVSARVTVTDIDGTNKPSQPYRMRVIVHEDDNGHMTGYDLKYPDGGN